MCCSAKRSTNSRTLNALCARGPPTAAGQALVEFAVVSLVVYMLLAAILTFGQILYCAQTLQQAADVAAREISRTPLLATANVMDVLYSNNPGDYSTVPATSERRCLILSFCNTT